MRERMRWGEKRFCAAHKRDVVAVRVERWRNESGRNGGVDGLEGGRRIVEGRREKFEREQTIESDGVSTSNEERERERVDKRLLVLVCHCVRRLADTRRRVHSTIVSFSMSFACLALLHLCRCMRDSRQSPTNQSQHDFTHMSDWERLISWEWVLNMPSAMMSHTAAVPRLKKDWCPAPDRMRRQSTVLDKVFRPGMGIQGSWRIFS
jgi:hypothetical protein